MSINNRSTIAVLLIAGIFLSSCLRYVPSREELEEDSDQPAAEYAGEEAFFGIEKEQRERLEKLVRTRSAGQDADEDPSYRIGIGDVLEITVFDVEELTGKFRVRPTGHISLPLIGTIEAKGQTEAEIQDEITKRLDEFVYNPQVHVFISDYAAHKVWVIGEVQKPGAYPLTRDNYSLLELLSEAGGRTDQASSLVYLIPDTAAPTAGERVRGSLTNSLEPEMRSFGVEIYFDDLIGSVDSRPIKVPLHPGDSIVVPEAGNVQVDGEVKTPGSHNLASKMSLLGAIASAGGLTYSADVHKVEVIRELGSGKKALITVDLEELALRKGNDIRLRDSDIVRVPSEPGRFATRQTINVFNGLLGRFVPSF